MINALKFYFEKVRKETRTFLEITPRKAHKIPGTLSGDEILKLLY